MIIKPRKGQTKLSDEEISQATGLIWNGATTTIDMLLGEELSEEDKEKVRQFEASIKSMGLEGIKEVKE